MELESALQLASLLLFEHSTYSANLVCSLRLSYLYISRAELSTRHLLYLCMNLIAVLSFIQLLDAFGHYVLTLFNQIYVGSIKTSVLQK